MVTRLGIRPGRYLEQRGSDVREAQGGELGFLEGHLGQQARRDPGARGEVIASSAARRIAARMS